MPRTALGISLGALVWGAACAGSSDPYLPQPSERLPPQEQEQPAAQSPAEETAPTPQSQPSETQAADDASPAEPAPAQQGTSCAAAGVSFSARQPLVACGAVDIVVGAGEGYTWVMAGISAPGQAATWRGGATGITCSGGACRWTFANTSVPCAEGPYTLHFMVDAEHDDPAQGREIASCVP